MKNIDESFVRLFQAAGFIKKVETQTELKNILNVSDQSITNWKSRGVPDWILIKLHNDWGLNSHWVKTGQGLMLNKSNNTADSDQSDIVHHSHLSNVSIPEYDAIGSMGSGVILRDQSGVINRWEVSEDWIQKNLKGYTHINNVAIVTGFGDSMKGLFNSGDPLIVDTGVTEYIGDSPYFFRIENEGYIKRLQKIPGIGLVAISDNKAYERFTITADMDFAIFGRIIKAWHGVDL